MKALYGLLFLLLFSCQQKDEKKLTVHEKYATKETEAPPARKKSKSIGETTHVLYIDIAKEKTYINKTIHSIKA